MLEFIPFRFIDKMQPRVYHLLGVEDGDVTRLSVESQPGASGQGTRVGQQGRAAGSRGM